jgi:5-bromo-4-chloroindolyl phosphate hydrolysis protein
MTKLHVFKDKVELLETITELEKDIKVDKELMDELLQTRILQSEVHSDIEKVWMYDATLTKDLSAYQKRKRSEAIERVFYKVANQWI